MSSDAHILPPLSPEQRRVAAGQFDRATQALAAGGHDYAIQLLLSCCQIDPANLLYRQALRRAQKAKYRNNLRGGLLSFLINFGAKARFRSARRAHDYLRMLEFGEQILVRNPWDTKTQIDMARAAQILDLLDLAIWILEEARQKNPLAQIDDKRGVCHDEGAVKIATDPQAVTVDGSATDADRLESPIAKDPT